MNSSDPKKLFLVDGSSYLYRAYYAMPSLTNSKGEPTGAIFGVVNMLRNLLTTNQYDYVGIIFDAKGKTFRNDMYPEYKANRPPMPDDLVCQIEPIHSIIRAMGLPVLQVPGVEADDVIGTLARRAAHMGMKIVISTGDKDMAQLVDKDITLINTMTKERLDCVGVEEKFGIPPALIVDYLALMGDKSDNIPGIPKVGPKTAVKWLQQYGSITELITHASAIKGKVGEALRANLDQLELSQKLATIKCDLELEWRPSELLVTPPEEADLQTWYTNFEFRTWLKTPPPDEPSVVESIITEQVDYQTILSEDELQVWLEHLKIAKRFAFDTETTSLNYMEAQIVGVSFAIDCKSGAYVPLAHDYPGVVKQLDRDRVLTWLKPILEDPKIAKLGQNLKYDKNVLRNHGINLAGIADDTLLQSYVLDSTANRHDLDSLAWKYLNYKTVHYEDVVGKGSKQIPFNQVPLETAAPYATEDADIALRLYDLFAKQLAEKPKLQTLYTTIEMPLIPVLSRMEYTGVLIDIRQLKNQSNELQQQLRVIEQQAHTMAGEVFNLNSPKQIQSIFFDKLNLPILKKTPKGDPSTAEDVLQKLGLNHELPKLILEYRGLNKLKSTYTDRLPEQCHASTGRVHTSYHQAVTVTGRLSSSNPNLQNIPIRSAEGRRIRQAFIAPEGCCIVAADYSQIELRIMAHLSEDKGLLDAFAEGEDVHQLTAAEIFNVPKNAVTRDQRRSAKAINFGLIYGMSAFGLAEQLGITRKQAADYVDIYFCRYPGVKAFMDKMRAQAHDCGYVETVFGRCLYLPEIHSKNFQRRQYAERTAINAPMQGTAADIIKKAMIQVDDWIQTANPNARMIMQVHDELVFEVGVEEVDQVVKKIDKLMANAASLKVPLVVDIGVGSNWDEAH